MLGVSETAGQYQQTLTSKGIFLKKIEREILSRTLPTILFQIYCEGVLNFKVIIRSIEDTDNNIQYLKYYVQLCFPRELNCIFKSYLWVLCIETKISLGSMLNFEEAAGEFKGSWAPGSS